MLLRQVLLVPARPWQRGTQASAGQRLAMVELACRDNPALQPDAIELLRAGPSFTVETLRALRMRFGDHETLWLILGADAFVRLHTWHCWQELERLCHLAIVPRPGIDLAAAIPPALQAWWARQQGATPGAGTCGGLRVLTAPALEISATAIRRMVAERRSPRYLLPDPVLDYIEDAGIYCQEGHEP